MKIIIDDNKGLTSITGLTYDQRNIILEADERLELFFHWYRGLTGWCLLKLNPEQICWLVRKLQRMNDRGILRALDYDKERMRNLS